jgi:hypothetical protein
MMITSFDLDSFGKQAAENYVSSDVSLNDTITKIAEDNGLSVQQITRVVEAANVETYLSLLKTAKDKYVEFDVATANDVHTSVTKVAEVSNCHDYDEPPCINEDVALFYIEKTAEIPIDRAKIEKQASELSGKFDFLVNALHDNELEADTLLRDLKVMTKQALLQNVAFNDLGLIYKEAMPILGEAVLSEIKNTITENSPHLDLEKEASMKFVNEESDFFLAAQNFEKVAEKRLMIADAISHFEDKYEELKEFDVILPKLNKTAGSLRGLLAKIKGIPASLGEKMRKAKKLKASKEYVKEHEKKLTWKPEIPVKKTLKRVGIAGMVGGGYAVGKGKGKEDQGDILRTQLFNQQRLRKY